MFSDQKLKKKRPFPPAKVSILSQQFIQNRSFSLLVNVLVEFTNVQRLIKTLHLPCKICELFCRALYNNIM